MFILKENDHWEYISEKSGSAVLLLVEKGRQLPIQHGETGGRIQVALLPTKGETTGEQTRKLRDQQFFIGSDCQNGLTCGSYRASASNGGESFPRKNSIN